MKLGDPCPPVPEDLVEWLSLHFPPRCIGPTDSPELAHRYAGRVELIADLRGWRAAGRTETLDDIDEEIERALRDQHKGP